MNLLNKTKLNDTNGFLLLNFGKHKQEIWDLCGYLCSKSFPKLERTCSLHSVEMGTKSKSGKVLDTRKNNQIKERKKK